MAEKEVNKENSDGVTPLMLACERNDLELIKNLISRGASIGFTDKEGRTAAHYCAESADHLCMEEILTMCGDIVNERDNDGCTPLHWSVMGANIRVLGVLHEFGVDYTLSDNEKRTAVHFCVVHGQADILRALFQLGAIGGTPDIYGAHPLHYATQMAELEGENRIEAKTSMEILNILLEHHVSVDCRDNEDREPILWAASAGSTEAISLLVKAGANVNTVDKDGLTALHCASSSGHKTCVEALVREGHADINRGDKNGCTPLFYAVTFGHAQMTRTLLKLGADSSICDSSGRSAAHCGAIKGQTECLRVMARHKCDMWIRNRTGDYPLHEAANASRNDCVKFLLESDPPVQAIHTLDKAGRSLLHVAAAQNNLALCKLLIDSGIKRNLVIRTAKGEYETAFDTAIRSNAVEVATYLRSHGTRKASKVVNRASRDIQQYFRRNFSRQSNKTETSEHSETSRRRSSKHSIQSSDSGVSMQQEGKIVAESESSGQSDSTTESGEQAESQSSSPEHTSSEADDKLEETPATGPTIIVSQHNESNEPENATVLYEGDKTNGSVTSLPNKPNTSVTSAPNNRAKSAAVTKKSNLKKQTTTAAVATTTTTKTTTTTTATGTGTTKVTGTTATGTTTTATATTTGTTATTTTTTTKATATATTGKSNPTEVKIQKQKEEKKSDDKDDYGSTQSEQVSLSSTDQEQPTVTRQTDDTQVPAILPKPPPKLAPVGKRNSMKTTAVVVAPAEPKPKFTPRPMTSKPPTGAPYEENFPRHRQRPIQSAHPSKTDQKFLSPPRPFTVCSGSYVSPRYRLDSDPEVRELKPGSSRIAHEVQESVRQYERSREYSTLLREKKRAEIRRNEMNMVVMKRRAPIGLDFYTSEKKTSPREKKTDAKQEGKVEAKVETKAETKAEKKPEKTQEKTQERKPEKTSVKIQEETHEEKYEMTHERAHDKAHEKVHEMELDKEDEHKKEEAWRRYQERNHKKMILKRREEAKQKIYNAYKPKIEDDMETTKKPGDSSGKSTARQEHKQEAL